MFAATPPWNWSSAEWAGLTFLVLFGAAVAALYQANEARRLREEQARPFVVIDFEPWQTIIELRITNLGRTLARDVRFTFAPPLTSTHDKSEPDVFGNLMELNIFKKGIPSLAPGKEMWLFFDEFPKRLGQGLPLTYNVQVEYKGPSGRKFSEPIDLDLTAYLGTGRVTRHGLHDIHEQLKTISDNVKRWTDHGGLKILTRADIKEKHRENLEFLAKRRAEQQGAEESEAEGE